MWTVEAETEETEMTLNGDYLFFVSSSRAPKPRLSEKRGLFEICLCLWFLRRPHLLWKRAQQKREPHAVVRGVRLRKGGGCEIQQVLPAAGAAARMRLRALSPVSNLSYTEGAVDRRRRGEAVRAEAHFK